MSVPIHQHPLPPSPAQTQVTTGTIPAQQQSNSGSLANSIQHVAPQVSHTTQAQFFSPTQTTVQVVAERTTTEPLAQPLGKIYYRRFREYCAIYLKLQVAAHPFHLTYNKMDSTLRARLQW